jgi:hypothetical protein
MLTEGTPLRSLEALMNRMDYTHQSLMHGLHSGFYGPINRGALPGAIAQLHNNARLNRSFDAIIAKVLGGSDAIQGFTDQGMPTDPNGHLRRPGFPYLHHGGNDFTDWEGGPGGRAGARRFREALEAAVKREADLHPHGTVARLSDHIRHNNLLKEGKKAGYISSNNNGDLGGASLTVDFKNMPRGVRTSAKTSGLFKEAKLNRGRAMPMADSDA